MPPTFPSPLERTVASALLLLSTCDQPRSLSSPMFDTDGELLLKSKSSSDEESVSMSLVSSGDSKRCVSSVTTGEDGSSNEIRAHTLRIIDVVDRCHEVKLNVMRKSRSKISRKFKAGKKPPPQMEKPACSGSVSTEAGSCLSSSASAISSARSRRLSPDESSEVTAAALEKPRRKAISRSSHIERRAEAILKLLSSGGCSSEIKIRQALGDCPDTSKALRMLLKTDEVKRSGTGGRQDPYIYAIASN